MSGDPSIAAPSVVRDTEAPDVRVDGLQASRPVKRSFSIAGHRTSISLEAAFWDAFRELCREDGISMAAMLARIDRERGSAAGLSGTVRVWILQRFRARCDGEPPVSPNRTD